MKAENIQDIYELSPLQQGILFHSLYAPESAVYFVQLCYSLKGNFNVVAFERAWQEVVKRHTVLRTAFYWENLEKPLQVVHREVEVSLIQHDWRDINSNEQSQKLQDFLESDGLRPAKGDRTCNFDLTQPCLMRLNLIRCTDDYYYFIWSKHHLILDGWSTALVLKEVVGIYQLLCQGKDLPLVLESSFGNYIGWLQQQDLNKAKEFWQQSLQGFTAPTPLINLNSENSSNQPDKYNQQLIKLSQTTTAALQSLARQNQLTLNTLVQGAYALLLSRYSREIDIVYGVTFSGRPADLAKAESIVGMFINTLPVRVKIDAEESLLSWLRKLQSQLAEIRQYEYSPLVDVQGWSEVPRGLPLFESILVFENYPIDTALKNGMQNLEIQSISSVDNTNYPLTVTVIPASELEVTISYNCDACGGLRQRFHPDTITRMLGHLVTLLENMIADVNQPMASLPMLTEVEKHQLLVEWNNTQVDYPQDKCIHQLFEEQVEKTPDAVAVVFVDAQSAASRSRSVSDRRRVGQHLTYKELNQRANQLANYLQKLGVTSEVLVGICIERSLEMLVGILGILKAGGAYIPLDPSYPQQRLAFMLKDAQLSILITKQNLVATLPPHQAQIVCLDSDWEKISQHSLDNLTNKTNTKNLAYVIYTSGSTGQPKGVQITHGSLVNFLSTMRQTPGLNQEDIFLSVTTLSFDIAALELYLPLIVGARVVIVSREVATDGIRLLKELILSNATVMQATPATWRMLLAAGWESSQQLKILCGGEALDSNLAHQLLERSKQVWNLYGPTETTIWSSVHKVENTNQSRLQNIISIGRPIANTEFYILDQNQQLVPVGVPGELHIGGAGLARGYLNRPELTQEKFITNPFSHQPDVRLYKTGDLARYLPNGELEYIGRIDNQVKLRGFRIELGEIEAAINQHPSVSTSAVVVRQDESANQSLVAYITLHSNKIVTITELRRFLELKLPNYMVPIAIVVLETLPLTPNGKIDRRALPAPNLTQLISESNFVAPATPVEEMLAGVWAEVLGLEKVGVKDNFFELGGHSLLATRVISQIRQVFEVEIPLRRLFELPTVSELGKEIQTAINADKGLEVPPIKSIARSPKLPLSFAQQRLWFLNQFEPNSPFYNIPAAVRLEGQLNLAALEQSFNEILRRHEVLRTNFQTVEGQAIAVISPTTQQLLTVIDLSELPSAQRETKVRQLALAEAQRPFNLEADTLLRVKLLRLSKQEYVALLTMHHIVSDGWSMDVLVREVATLYQAFCNGQPSPLPELEIQYADFAAWQRQWLEGEALETQLAYWLKQLDGAPGVLELPTDYPRPAIQSSRGAIHSFCLSSDQFLALKSLSQQQGSTLFMTLLAAFKILLHRYTGSNDIVIGSPIANRNHSQIEGLIGFFANTLVLRTNLEGNPSFQELLHRVKEVALGAYTHQDTPFEVLVEKIQPQRNLSHTPLFQVMFVLQNAQNSEIELPGLILSTLENDSATAKFDLTLEMKETAEGLVGTLKYSIDLFEPQTIQKMTGHLQTLLSEIIANPEQKLSELPLLTQTEQHQLLVEWNQTQADYPQDKCIHQLFEAQVEKTPDAVAVVFENQQLTYRELNQQANQLAHYLQKLGVGPEALVGICVERSLEMLVGLLGILKAGGAYVPLDPNYPSKRLAWMIEDSQLSVVFTQSHLLVGLSKYQAKVVCLDNDWQTIAQECDANPDVDVIPNNLAYIIYTSGSTGKPKGVQILHQAVVNFLTSIREVPGLTAQDILLAVTTISFDIAVLELFLPIVVGARIVLASREVVTDATQLIKLLTESRATVMQATPATWRMLLAADWQGNQQLKILCGGEALPRTLVNQLLARSASVWNMYGPTETTIWSAVELIESTDIPVCIGHPIANTQIYLIDPNSYHNSSSIQLVPVGLPGELLIGGAGLARGYLNHPELTTDKFIPNPFSKEAGARLYKTGDLACYLPNGKIEFLGRIDHQIKVNGYRIELGEIEVVLSQHPAIQETVVVVQTDEHDKKRIVGYLVTREQVAAPSTSELRRFLSQKLPEYMIPSVFVQIAALPLTPNGKVDRKALPVPDDVRTELDKQFMAPRTFVESKLAQIWAEVLRVEQVGIYDNFFDLGGDSILTIQIIAKANQSGLQLTPKQLFQYQNIAELAGVCITNEATLPEQRLITGNVPLTPVQQWFFEQNLINPHHDNQAVLLEVQQELDPQLLNQALQQLVIHHDALRLRFEQKESGWQQFHAPVDDTVSFSLIDLSEIPQNEQKSALEAAANELQSSLNLFQGSLVKAALFNLGDKQHSRILVAIHHLVVDGVSWRILLEDLETAYTQLSRGETIKLPAKTTSFKKWSEKLREYANSTVAKKELDYWLEKATKQVSSVPIDFSGGANTVASTGVVSVKLNVEETKLLLKEVPSAYRIQINDVLLTALVQAFAQWTGDKSLLIHLEGRNREDIFDDVDLSRTVGWVTSLFPVLLDIRETSSVGEALKVVKEQLRAIPNRGIGYGTLRYTCENTTIAKSLRIPQSEVVFNYLGDFDQTLAESSLFKFATESCGSTRSVQNNRNELLEINGFVVDGQLQVNWSYSEELHRRSTIAALSESFVDALRSLITHCTSPAVGGYTPSDFPLVTINQQQLDDLLQKQQQIEDIYPLSPMQQGMLFHTLYDQNSAAYVTQTSCILRGKLDLSAFQQAWQKLIERHTILRTAFYWEGLDTPLQVVLKHIDLPYQQQDWRELTPNDQQTRLEILLETDYKQGFNLAIAPLMRLILIQLADDTYLFIWSHHHLLLDGWSTPVLLQEVFVLYQAFCRNQFPSLEKIRPYRDYIAWLQQQDFLEAQNFWRRVLKGFTTPTAFGINRNSQKSVNDNPEYHEQEIKLSLATTTALQLLVKQNKLTLNTVLQGAWALLLSHYSSNKDVIFGATVSNRPAALIGVESMVGLFINTLPVRVQIFHHENLISWLQQIQSQQVETRHYEYTPLADIHKFSEVPQGVSLFESVMVFENFPNNSSLQDELDLEIDNTRTIIRNHYPLTLRVRPDSELSLDIMYDRSCLEPRIINKITNHFEILLSQFANQPHIQLKELATLLTSTDQQQQVLKEKELEKVSLQKFKQTKRKTIHHSS
ncbi:amino acid adenylation domain-containing protein [Fortiea sp. LEGE XX443]|uniref:non-ribosomal peptide synthetase n=1 Tax=Fortiea sp. LEGE XX443 TaxID=1828611 RepID=UPI001882270C|nr:non-ribosomal peptide synthetase [Fortiea sp. LEGE XX443]MBE9004885.1 amino acid adenylation domain-containing protein [Fortiea sp. LEGE XX443]